MEISLANKLYYIPSVSKMLKNSIDKSMQLTTISINFQETKNENNEFI